jgi:hypothetical protein
MIKKNGKTHLAIGWTLAGMVLAFLFAMGIEGWRYGHNPIWPYGFAMIVCVTILNIFNWIVLRQPANSEQQIAK